MKNFGKIFGIVLLILMALAVALGLWRRPGLVRGLNENKTASIKPGALDNSDNHPATVTFLAGGDIMLSRNVASAIAKAHDPVLPFHNLADLLLSTDFNFANLESPISGNNSFNPSPTLLFNAPLADTVGLKTYNFQILNLANNHALDQGKAGLLYTKNYLAGLGLATIGTGANLDDAWQSKIITARGIRIGFIGASYASINDGGKTSNTYVARLEDTERLKAAITALKPQADFIVITMHAGTEYTRLPNAEQTAFAHAAIDDGADLVLGAHPHWIQTIEQYAGKYIFYSLGNFIFDQEWSRETKEGLALKVTLEQSDSTAGAGSAAGAARLKQIELLPVIIENYSTPRLATSAEAQTILKKINQSETILRP